MKKVRIRIDGIEHEVEIREDLIRKEGSQYCVTTEGGERIACHQTREAAERQLAAIEASKSRQDRADSDGMVSRMDFGTFSKIERTPTGGLKIPSSLTRVGIFTYRRADGTTIRELRPREEVFKADSLASLRGAPVTDLHPNTMVSSQNWKKLATGHVSEKVDHDGKFVRADLFVQDSDMIHKIESGARKEISCGYRCRIDATPGVFNGERYDVIQRDITYNHAALGPPKWGRAGSEVSIHMDSNDAIMTPLEEPPEKKMKKVRIDGIEYEVGTDAYFQARERQIAGFQSNLDSMTKERDELKGKLEVVTKEHGEIKSKLDAAIDPKMMQAKVQARATLETQARKIIGKDDVKFDDKTDRQVMEEALLAKNAEMKFDGLSDDHISGMFTMTSPAEGTERNDALGKTREAVVNPPKTGDNKPRTSEQARLDMIENNRKAWEQPLAASSQKG
jgi:hypothetical protein